MTKILNVKVILPDFSQLTPREERECIKKISNDITEHVVAMVKVEKQKDNIAYWQHKLLEWQIEDFNNEVKSRVLNEQRRIAESHKQMGVDGS